MKNAPSPEGRRGRIFGKNRRKKAMRKRCLSLALALVALVTCALALTGCGGKEDLTGEWTAELDLTDGMRAYLEEEMAAEMEELAPYIDGELFDFDSLKAVIVWKMTLDEDGAITMSLDGQGMADSLMSMVEGGKDKLVAAIPAILEESFAQQGLTVEQARAALEAQGMTLEEMVDQMAQELEESFESETRSQLDDMELNVEEKGYYTVDRGRLYVMDNKGDRPSEDSYLAFTRDGDTLTITDMPDELKESFAELEEMGGSVLPVTFTRS